MPSHYALENKNEASRLEEQAHSTHLSFQNELNHFKFNPGWHILDAGCGSGIVSRHLASTTRGVQVEGCDLSEDRIQAAKEAASDLKNVAYVRANLSALPYENNKFDCVICRYVLEHVTAKNRKEIYREFLRVLKPGGSLYVIDVDGILANLYPQPQGVASVIQKLLSEECGVDLQIGRKLHFELRVSGFQMVDWQVKSIPLQGPSLLEETQLMAERFKGFKGFLAGILKDEARAQAFCDDYLKAMTAPGSTLFYNMFFFQAVKDPALSLVRARG